MFHVLMIICFYESTAIRQRMEHRKSFTKSVFDDFVVKIIPLQREYPKVCVNLQTDVR